jgi:hypothetical protein
VKLSKFLINETKFPNKLAFAKFHNKAPGAGWSLVDTTKNVAKVKEADFIANNYDKHRNRTKSNAIT